jgi:FtsP/CotA-like multicopper oxidase with cupredoxin domain
VHRQLPEQSFPHASSPGDVISVTLVNDLPYETSIHFHGLWQRGSAQYDGVPSVTQCPIPPGQTFEYRVPTVGQAGTFW